MAAVARSLTPIRLSKRSSEKHAQSMLRTYVSRLRAKLAAAGLDPTSLKSLRGTGYFLAARP